MTSIERLQIVQRYRYDMRLHAIATLGEIAARTVLEPNGTTRDQNPYEIDSKEFVFWLIGYDRAMRAMK